MKSSSLIYYKIGTPVLFKPSASQYGHETTIGVIVEVSVHAKEDIEYRIIFADGDDTWFSDQKIVQKMVDNFKKECESGT